MKIHSKELLRAILACKQIRPSRPLASEYGMVRIRIGWGIDCCEAFDCSTLIRYYIHPQYEDGERLDGAFEYDPLVAWLSYVDGEIDISENGPVRFEFGRSSLEKGTQDATSFPVRNAPDRKGKFVVIAKEDWKLLQTQLGSEDDPVKSTDVYAVHLMPGKPAYAGTSYGVAMAVCEVESTIDVPTVIPAGGINAAFKATDADIITIESVDNWFCVCKDEIELFFQGTSQPGILTNMIQYVLGQDTPFLTLGLTELRDVVAAISATNKSANARPRAMFYTDNGELYIVGGELWDFRSLPLRPIDIEFPEEFSGAVFNARMIHSVLNCIETGQLWFTTDPREGPVDMKIIGGTRQVLFKAMKIRRQ